MYRYIFYLLYTFVKNEKNLFGTGKSLSETLIFASINPLYDKRLFMVIPWCGLIDAKIRASDKDIPVPERYFFILNKCVKQIKYVYICVH